MNDDLDEEIMDEDDGFDEFSQESNLGDAVRKNPYAKIGIVVVGIAVIVGVVMLFGQETIETQESSIPTGSDVTSVPGTDEKISPAYAEAVEQQNEEDLERAITEGSSSIPVPIKTYDTRLEVPETEEKSEDPLLRWRMLQEERVEREMKIREAETEPVTVLNAEQQSQAITDLASSMEEQMSSLLTASDESKSFQTKTLINYAQEEEGVAGGDTMSETARLEDPDFEEETKKTVIIPAGKIVYGQLLLQANSDIPLMVLGQMVSGPLKGWKILGEFTVIEDFEKLAITFNVAVNEAGDQYDINAIMLDPNSGLAALATDVDHRYFRRVVFPAAAAFVEGFSQALAETGRTSVTVEGGAAVEETEEADDDQQVALGIEEAAQELGTVLDDMADVPIQIVIAAGTPIGIFFVENVVDQESDI